MASTFSDSLMTMKSLPDVATYKEAQNQKKIYITYVVCTSLTKVQENQICGNQLLDMLT